MKNSILVIAATSLLISCSSEQQSTTPEVSEFDYLPLTTQQVNKVTEHKDVSSVESIKIDSVVQVSQIKYAELAADQFQAFVEPRIELIEGLKLLDINTDEVEVWLHNMQNKIDSLRLIQQNGRADKYANAVYTTYDVTMKNGKIMKNQNQIVFFDLNNELL